MEELNEKLYERILKFDDTRKKEWIRERKPYAVLFELTSNCNFNCVHCYLQNNHIFDVLSTENILKILDILCEKGIIFITFTGGEIFTRKDFCEIYLYAKKKGFIVELFTNGYNIDDKIITLLKEYPPLLVSVSIYGANDDTYYKVTGIKDGFSQVYENCKKLVSSGIRLSMKSPIISLTEKEMPEMKKLASDIGVQMIFSFEIHNSIDGSDNPINYRTSLSNALKYEFDDFLTNNNVIAEERINKNTFVLQNNPYIFTCNVATNSFVVDYQGNMLPCMKLRHRGVNIFESDFDLVWDRFKIYKELKASKDNNCKKCDSVYFCDACPAEMDFLYGNAENIDCNNCKAARIREQFYKGKIDYKEALKKADKK